VLVALPEVRGDRGGVSQQASGGGAGGEKPNAGADAGASEGEGDRASEGQGAWMSMVDASGAKLVTQDDV